MFDPSRHARRFPGRDGFAPRGRHQSTVALFGTDAMARRVALIEIAPTHRRGAARTGIGYRALFSSEDTRCRGSLITRVRRASWFDQQNVDLPACHGPMFKPLGRDKHLAGAEGDRAIPQLMSSVPLRKNCRIRR
jgi:hypothetical protein